MYVLFNSYLFSMEIYRYKKYHIFPPYARSLINYFSVLKSPHVLKIMGNLNVLSNSLTDFGALQAISLLINGVR